MTAVSEKEVELSVVIPSYNEEKRLESGLRQALAYLARRGDAYELLVVDDGSRDATAQVAASFGGEGVRVLRHERNRGVAAAIETGIRSAKSDIVCSMDCDCTYDPHDLGQMIPLLSEGVDMVTASPYHPRGRVKNVPRWRLFLSKSLSRLYRLVLRQKLHTYTNCFRVYRRQTAAKVSVERGGFFGVTELLGRLDLAGATIVEFPATLEARMLGRSKMKVLRTIAGHLGLLIELFRLRLRGGGPSIESPLPHPAHE